MNNKGIRIYAIIISAVAAILLAAIIIMGINLSVTKSLQEPDPQTEMAGVSDTVDISGSENAGNEAAGDEDIAVESQDDVLNNVSGLVGWEQGNNDVQNVVNAWKISIAQLDLDVDIAFFGDSITSRGDFRSYFPDKKVINLGCGGDTIRGVYNRAEVLSYVHAEKIFVMCGVNMLRNDNIEICEREYGGLLNAIQEYAPDSEVYVCSILPMGQDWQAWYCRHETTEEFNRIISILAGNRGMTYVELYSLFEQDGVIKPEYTVDGIHLTEAGYDLWMQTIYPYVYY